MIELGMQTVASIETSLKALVEKLSLAGNSQPLITDIHLLPCRENGLLLIYDDEDQELAHIEVAEWTESESTTFYQDVEKQLLPIINNLHNQGLLTELPLLKPYSFVLVDDEHETVAELLLVDDETMMLSEGLLKGLDEELDEFLKRLLEE